MRMSRTGSRSRILRITGNQCLPSREPYHCSARSLSAINPSVPIPRRSRSGVGRASPKPRSLQRNARLGRYRISSTCSFQFGWPEHPTCNSSPRDEHRFNLLPNDDSSSRHDLSALSLHFPGKRGRPSLLRSLHSDHCGLSARGGPEHFRIATRILQTRHTQKRWTSISSYESFASIARECWAGFRAGPAIWPRR